MVINMDVELQRLICVSVEKMTREPVPSRKGKGLDLRKALLVAHVLQDMRTAYIADDYKVLVNTVCPNMNGEEIERTLLKQEYNEAITGDVLSHKRAKFLSDDWATGTIDRPPRSENGDAPFMTSPYRCPSGTQSCVPTCSDATMSKISQITHPIPVSINTSYILSHQTEDKDDEIAMDSDTPAVSEQVEVASVNELESEQVESAVIHCEEYLNVGPESPEIIVDPATVTTYTDLSDNRDRVSCPLPRKKRPLPKEYLESNSIATDDAKRTRLQNDTVTSSLGVIVTSSPCRLLNTTTATTVTQSTALSYAKAPTIGNNSQSTHVTSTATSSVCSFAVSATATASLCNSVVSSSATANSDSKVVVELMNKSAWTWSLPATCTQPKLSRCLMDGVYCSQLIEAANLRDSSVHAMTLKNLVAV